MATVKGPSLFVFLAMVSSLTGFHLERAEAPSQKFLFTASISVNSKHFCSGAILNKQWIITSADCVAELKDLKDVIVRYGSHNRSHEHGKTQSIVETVVHPDFQKKMLLNNMALLRTKEPIEFIPTVVQPAALPTIQTYEDEKAYACGWEKSPVTDTPDILKYHLTTVMALDLCYERLEDINEDNDEVKVTDNVICTYYSAEQGVPELDNGSPLVSTQKDELIGIASWHKDDYPNVYARVFSYVSWIRSIISQ